VHRRSPRPDVPPSGELSVIADEVTCEQFVELLTDYLEGALSPQTHGLVEEHLVMCDWCVTYTEQMQATLDALRLLRDRGPREPPDPLLAAVRGKRENGL
jgi:predicted anti-sigma-YlaC factor YlaD